MLKTMLLLDGCSTMNASVDYLPTRLLALKTQLHQYIRTYLDLSPLSLLGTVVMRDTTAHILSPLTNSPSQIIDTLELRYFLQGGSGAMSLECGLRACFSQLVELRKKNGASGRSGALHVVLITASVSLVDGGDVRSLVDMVRRAGIRVDVVHLVGSVYALQQLAERTGGEYYCPMNYDHLRRILLQLPYEASTSRRKKRGRSDAKEEDPEAAILVPVGFPEVAPALEYPAAGKSYLVCPRCKLPQRGVPSVCPMCSLVISSLPFIHMGYIWRNRLVPPALTATPKPGIVEGEPIDVTPPARIKCCLCDIDLDGNRPDQLVASVCADQLSFRRCSACGQPRCHDCHHIVCTSLGVCPSCIA